MTVVTPEFIEDIIRSGPLTRARGRLLDGSARPLIRANWDKFSAWSLICEEILDTEHDDNWYDDIVVELIKRGFDFDEIDAMRRFAWKTVGWLNFDMVLWEWVRLDEKEMRIALDWQLRDALITCSQHDEGLAIIENPRRALHAR